MSKYLILLIACLHTLGFTTAHAQAEALDCTFAIKGVKYPSQCFLNFTPAADIDTNLSIQANISLQPLISNFTALLQQKLDKHSCEERIRVKSASLSAENGQLLARANIWIEKRVCKHGLKTRIFEKTGELVVALAPEYQDKEIRLVSSIIQSGLSDLEENLLKFIGQNPREKIKQSLDESLRISLAQTQLPASLQESIQFSSVQIASEPPALNIGIAARLDTRSIVELLEFTQRK